MNSVLKFFYGLSLGVGFILVLGAAGSDCDGKCMENAMSMSDTLYYSGIGLVLMALGALGLRKTEW